MLCAHSWPRTVAKTGPIICSAVTALPHPLPGNYVTIKHVGQCEIADSLRCRRTGFHGCSQQLEDLGRTEVLHADLVRIRYLSCCTRHPLW